MGVALALSLSGCMKARMMIEVKPDGSGKTSLAIGMTQQLKDLITRQSGKDPFEEFTKTQRAQTDQAQVTTRRWTEADYEWGEESQGFGNLGDLNTYIQRDASFFKRFSLTRKIGLLKNRFTLDAEARSLTEGVSNSPYTLPGLDASAVMEIQVGARLPGQIVETNGSATPQDPTLIVWNLQAQRSTPIKAIAEAWNWLHISGLCLGATVIVGLGVAIYHSRRQPKSVMPVDQS